MLDKEGRLDLMGQILFTGYKIKVHAQIPTPAHQNIILSPFTEGIRGRANNTPLTMTILRNAQRLTPRKQVDVANDLLEQYDIYLEPVR